MSNHENLFLDASPIYPNPSNGIVNLSFNLESAGDVFVRIYNQYGQLVYQKAAYFNAGSNMAVMPTDLAPGQYYVTAENGNRRFSAQQLVILK